jgi:hypothetical protein
MAQRRQIRVSRSLEGGGERPARRYGVTLSRRVFWRANVQREGLGSHEPDWAG